MPIPTVDNRTNFKEYIRYFKKKFTSQIQTIDLQYIRGMFSSEDSSLPDNTSIKFIVFDNTEIIDVSTEIASNDYLYIPALPGDYITLKFNSKFHSFRFEEEDGGIIYNETKYGLNNKFQIDDKIFTVKGLGGVLLQVEDAPSYSISQSATLVNEGDTVTFTVTTTAIPNGTVIYYTVDGTVESADFTDNTMSGSLTINNNSAILTKTLSSDFTVEEGSEIFSIDIRTDNLTGTVVASSNDITIIDTSFATFTNLLSTTSINEGDTVTVTVNTTGIPDGSTLFYTTSKTTDITPISGSFVINNNTGSFNIVASEDLLVENDETFTVNIRTTSITGSIVSTTDPITISNTTSFSITSSTNLPAEGDTVTFTVTTTGVADGTILYYTTSNTASTADDINSTSGSFTITNNSGSFDITTIQDFQPDDGEGLDIHIRTNSITGPIVASANTLTITDSAFSISITPQATVVFESNLTTNSTMIVDISSVDVPDGSTFNAVLTGTNIDSEDFGGTTTFPFTINDNVSSFVIPFTRDAKTEGAETFTIEVKNDNGTTLATSGVIVITDVSFIGSRKTNKTFGPIPVNRDNGVDENASDWYDLCGLDSLPNGSKISIFLDNSGSMTTNTVRASWNKLLAKLQQKDIDVIVVENNLEDWITPFDVDLN